MTHADALLPDGERLRRWVAQGETAEGEVAARIDQLVARGLDEIGIAIDGLDPCPTGRQGRLRQIERLAGVVPDEVLPGVGGQRPRDTGSSTVGEECEALIDPAPLE